MTITTIKKFVHAKPEFNSAVRNTVASETFTIREIVERSAAGLPVSGAHVPIYRGKSLFPDFDKLDISERYAIVQQVKEEVKARRLATIAAAREASEKLIYDKVFKEFEARKAAENASPASSDATSNMSDSE